jgi:flagellar M-ring protein FliF
MPVEIKNILNTIKTKWGTLAPGQRMGLMISGVVAALIAGGIIMWAATPDYKPLFSNVSESDGAKILKKLDEDKVSYKLDKATGAILVPENALMKERMKVAGSGMAIGGGVGFELFDKVNFGMSEEERRINYQRALQTELERTIDNIPGIEKSRVHLSIPEEKVFDDEQLQAKASVYLKLKAGFEIKKDQILGIQNLVASSVERLSPDGVALVSTDGKILTEGSSRDDAEISDRKLQLTQHVEDYYRTKIQSFLDNILVVNSSTVRVTASLQFNKIERAKESYNPASKQAPLIRNEDSSNDSLAQLNTGVVTTNVQAPAVPPVMHQKKTVSYELNKESERTTVTPGDVKNITVAVVLNGKYDAKYIADLKQSIAAAAGININNGDVIDIQAMEFKQSISKEETTKMEGLAQRDFYISLVKDYLPALALIIIGIIFAVNLGKGARSMSQAAYAPEDHGGNGSGRKLKPEEVLKMAKEDPKEAAKIIKSWIS